MSKLSTAYRARWKAQAQGRTCSCGSPAVTWRRDAFVCAVCAAAPVRKDYAGTLKPVRKPTSRKREEFYARRSGEDEGPICGDSLKELEARLTLISGGLRA